MPYVAVAKETESRFFTDVVCNGNRIQEGYLVGEVKRLIYSKPEEKESGLSALYAERPLEKAARLASNKKLQTQTLKVFFFGICAAIREALTHVEKYLNRFNVSESRKEVLREKESYLQDALKKRMSIESISRYSSFSYWKDSKEIDKRSDEKASCSSRGNRLDYASRVFMASSGA